MRAQHYCSLVEAFFQDLNRGVSFLLFQDQGILRGLSKGLYSGSTGGARNCSRRIGLSYFVNLTQCLVHHGASQSGLRMDPTAYEPRVPRVPGPGSGPTSLLFMVARR